MARFVDGLLLTGSLGLPSANISNRNPILTPGSSHNPSKSEERRFRKRPKERESLRDQPALLPPAPKRQTRTLIQPQQIVRHPDPSPQGGFLFQNPNIASHDSAEREVFAYNLSHRGPPL
jgi:hypothetical protein